MREWKVSFVITGRVQADTVTQALTVFRDQLGLTPEESRPRIRVTDAHAWEVEPEDPGPTTHRKVI